MAIRDDYTDGTITLISGSVDFTTVGSALISADIRKGDQILLPAKGAFVLVEAITGENSGKLSDPCPALAAGAGQNLRIRFQADGQRYAAKSQTLMLRLDSGNIEAFAGLAGDFEKIAMFTGPGAMELIDKADLVQGVTFDVRVDTIADRAAYDANSKDFRVLVSNIGDGRSALYVKKSNALADWSVPSYITGPVGPMPTLSATATTLAPGASATAVATPVSGGYSLGLGIPAGRGFYNKGAYSAGTAYSKDDVVTYSGSSYIAKQATTGNAPTNAAYWDLLAQKGLDGTGQGDVVGPSTAIDSNLAVFDTPTGKLVRDGGVGLSFLAVDAIATAKAAARGVYFPSRFADGFGGGGGVNSSTSSNYELDPANGRIIPARGALVAIPGSTGANIGNMTANGGLAAAFDGVASKAQSACASSNPSTQYGWIGKNYSAAARRIAALGILGSNDFGLDNATASATITVNLRAKMTTPSNGADGFLLATTSLADAASASASLFSGDTATAWNFVWVELSSTTLSYMVAALIAFSEVGPPLAMTINTIPAVANASPTSASGKLLIRANEALTLSTDVKVYLSRDGGVTNFAATLNQVDTLGPNALIDIASTAFSGAAGTKIAMRIQTPTAKNVEIHGYSLEWK